MLIELTNFRFKGKPVDFMAGYIKNMITSGLGELGITSNTSHNNSTISMKPVKEKKLFISSTKNKILLKPSDPRVAKTGRDYLSSERLTEDQYDGMIETLHGFFDKTGIECDIKFYEFVNDSKSFTLWREGKTRHKIFKPATFPVKV